MLSQERLLITDSRLSRLLQPRALPASPSLGSRETPFEPDHTRASTAQRESLGVTKQLHRAATALGVDCCADLFIRIPFNFRFLGLYLVPLFLDFPLARLDLLSALLYPADNER